MATAASIQAVQEAYIAYYGRPGDPAGIDFWAERLDAAGGNIDAMISSFGTSAEASARYASLSVTDAVNAIYNQVLGRDAEAGATGIDFYVNKVLSGEFSLVTLAQNIWDGATSGTDAQTVANKLTAANSFTQTLRDDAAANTAYAGDNAAGNARNWLAEVDSTEATVTAQTAAIATTIATISETPTNPGTTYTLTTAATDVVSSTERDDVVNTTKTGQLQTGDTISDPSTSDLDVLNGYYNNTSSLPQPKITNIETVNIKGAYILTGLDLSLVSGAGNVVVSTDLAGGTGALSNVSTSATQSIEAGTNITSIRVDAAATGTRETVSVNLNGASGTLTGGAGVDVFSVTAGSGSTLRIASTDMNDTGDSVVLANEDTALLTVVGNSAIASMTLNSSGAITLKTSEGLASGVTVNSNGSVLIDHTGAASLLYELKLTNAGSGAVTINIDAGLGDGLEAGTAEFSLAQVDVLRIDAGAGSADVIKVHEDTLLEFGADLATATTVGVGSGLGVVTTDGSYNLRLGLDASQTGKITTDASLGAIDISSSTGTTVTMAELELNAITDVVTFSGSNPITITLLDGDSGETIVNGQNATGIITITSASALIVYGGAGNDVITAAATATLYGGSGDDTLNASTIGNILRGEDGNDTLVGNSGVDTIFGGAGDDIITGAAGSDVITTGDGTDRVRLNQADDDTITDFTVGEDILQIALSLTAGQASLDLSSMTVTASTNSYTILTGTSAVLTGNTGTDLSQSAQLGWNESNTFNFGDVTASVTGGVFHDYVAVASTNTSSSSGTLLLGRDHQDTVILGQAGTATSATNWKDFELNTDRIILTGSAVAAINVEAVSYDTSSKAITLLGGSATIGLWSGTNAISNASTLDMAGSIQFGFSGSTAMNNAFEINQGTTVIGDLDDVIQVMSAGAVVRVLDNGGLDFIGGSADNDTAFTIDYTSIDGISTAEELQTANEAAVETEGGTVYVFANGEDGADTSKLEYVGSHSAGAASLADVATFLNANFLGLSTGEKLIAVIGDHSGDAAYTYLINVSGSTLSADDLTLITIIDHGDSLALTNFGTSNA